MGDKNLYLYTRKPSALKIPHNPEDAFLKYADALLTGA